MTNSQGNQPSNLDVKSSTLDSKLDKSTLKKCKKPSKQSVQSQKKKAPITTPSIPDTHLEESILKKSKKLPKQSLESKSKKSTISIASPTPQPSKLDVRVTKSSNINLRRSSRLTKPESVSSVLDDKKNFRQAQQIDLQEKKN